MDEQVTVFGAGKIGRSFVAPVFSKMGYGVCFVDADDQLVRNINELKEYRVTHIDPEGTTRVETIGPVRAVSAFDREAVNAAVQGSSVVVTAVGKGALPKVLASIADALAATSAERARNLILAENVHHAGDLARSVLDNRGVPEGTIGIVETSIGKMVPNVAKAADDGPIDVAAESYNTLIVDRDAWQGDIPESENLMAVSPIQAYVDRKLYIHNFGHAAAAYLGHLRMPDAMYISQVVSDDTTRNATLKAMMASARALNRMYPETLDMEGLEAHVEDLLKRFGSPVLYDQVYRVGGDLVRKLSSDDRVVGALRNVARFGSGTQLAFCADVYVAALRFRAAGEDGQRLASDDELLRYYDKRGLPATLRAYSGLDADREEDRPVWDAIIAAEARIAASMQD